MNWVWPESFTLGKPPAIAARRDQLQSEASELDALRTRVAVLEDDLLAAQVDCSELVEEGERLTALVIELEARLAWWADRFHAAGMELPR